VKQSSRLLNEPDKDADHEPQSNCVWGRRRRPIIGIGEQHLPARQPRARRSRTDRAAAADILIGPNQEGE
jgi:hypothetical protein